MAASSFTCRRGRSVGRTNRSLLETLQGVIERTYDLETGIDDIAAFVIGDAGYQRTYGASDAQGNVVRMVGSGRPWMASPGARTLVRQADGGIAISIYYPDSLVECLERHDPTRRLDDANVDAFAILVEELDHFLVIAERFRAHAAMTLLELELHANVTKYLVLRMFLGKLRAPARPSEADAAWIRHHLFHAGDFAETDADLRWRYRQAARLAARYVSRLDGMPQASRLPELRRFHRLPSLAKIAHINAASR